MVQVRLLEHCGRAWLKRAAPEIAGNTAATVDTWLKSGGLAVAAAKIPGEAGN